MSLTGPQCPLLPYDPTPGSEEDEIAPISVSPLHPPLALPLVDAEM